MEYEWFFETLNDPRWRTIARISGQSVSLVLSVAIHVVVDASRNKGRVTILKEDIASALDVNDDAVEAIFTAMQDRFLSGDRLR